MALAAAYKFNMLQIDIKCKMKRVALLSVKIETSALKGIVGNVGRVFY
jgi:hypothetical protein